MPEVIPSLTTEVNLDVVKAGGVAIADSGSEVPLGAIAHINFFFSAFDTHDFTLGLSAYYEGTTAPAALFATDFMYQWKALTGTMSLVLGGELFGAYKTNIDEQSGVKSVESPLGGYLFTQLQLTARSYVGFRYDQLWSPQDPAFAQQLLGTYASYYVSEFLRVRVGYEHRFVGLAQPNAGNTLFFDLNFTIGSHPTEPYWVNR